MDRLDLREFRNQLDDYNANIEKITCFNLLLNEYIENNLDDILDEHAVIGSEDINQAFESIKEYNYDYTEYNEVISAHGGWLITAAQRGFDNIHLSKDGHFKSASLTNFKFIVTVYDFTLDKALNRLLKKCEDNYNKWIQDEQKKQKFITINEYLDITNYFYNEVLPIYDNLITHPRNKNSLKEIKKCFHNHLDQIKQLKIIPLEK